MSLTGNGAITEQLTSEWEAGKDGEERINEFTGRRYQHLWNRLEQPAPGVLPSEACAVLRVLCAPNFVEDVRWIERRRRRMISGLSLEPRTTESHTWAALVGCRLGQRKVQFGLSGRGCGLAVLGSVTLRDRMRARMTRLGNAGPITNIRCDVVFSPAAAAVVVHEAIGHFAEAHPTIDLSHRCGTLLASQIVNAFDDPLAEGGAARYSVDDEGSDVLGPTQLVDAGRLVGLVHSFASGLRAGSCTTANARTDSVWKDALPRVSNLIVEPGLGSESDLIAELGEGLYVHWLADGVSSRGRIDATIILAEWVRRGRRTGEYVTSGYIRESSSVLTRVRALGNKSIFHENALCGKLGQMFFDVGTSAPAMLVTGVTIVSQRA